MKQNNWNVAQFIIGALLVWAGAFVALELLPSPVSYIALAIYGVVILYSVSPTNLLPDILPVPRWAKFTDSAVPFMPVLYWALRRLFGQSIIVSGVIVATLTILLIVGAVFAVKGEMRRYEKRRG